MNPRNFLLSTDYPIDKVVYQTTRTVTVGAYGFSSTNFAHGLPFKPLLVAQYSPNASYIPLYAVGSFPVSAGIVLYNTAIEADATNIYLAISNNTASSVTFRFNIYAFQPSGTPEAITSHTSVAGDTFSISTDYNYTKLIMSGVTGWVSGASASVTHGQGIVPQVMVWRENQSDGRVSPVEVGSYDGSFGLDYLIRVTTSTVSFANIDPFPSPARYHYRIYADE
ncbi:hypothetical protein E6Q11_00765 [Candidatus Dojkabacteria bacterium]|uniref:Uncharacterized protein n=1 Tax=Candidatus Dojkabacteria bacterium TaxID=2099670 RepID=A0A5C7JAJ5_9BACT|nr:MAG: hypothetical protein E6Q11_00765 [Candidatus Dojkabacteria bacterium]